MTEGDAAAFAKTICSICYEDLKPIIEDLQSISVCGHVFHELCLQQWFEYCTNGKKKNCPVCKQTCSKANVGRLYFQSIGDSNDRSLSQKPRDYCQNPEELCNEVKRLEGKVSGLTSSLEQQQKNFDAAMAELLLCKEQYKAEQSLKNETLKQKAAIQQLLHLKSESLDKSTLECMRLQERNMALAKELAALKLVSDLTLVEDEMLKLASLGNESNSKETIDVLRKSLVIRNKSYKELMAKCNALGRGEARSLSKLEKANEKIKKMKDRIQELESVIEANDNTALRSLKASNQASYEVNTLNNFDQASKTQYKQSPPLQTDIYQAEAISDVLPSSTSSTKKRKENSLEFINKKRVKIDVVDGKHHQDGLEQGPFSKIEKKKTSEVCSPEFSYPHLRPSENGIAVRESLSSIEDRKEGLQSVASCNDGHVSVLTPVSKSTVIAMPDSKDQDCVMLDCSVFSVRKEAPPAHTISQTGGRCFTAGLLGPDGTNWPLGKWCKKSKQNTEDSLQGSSARTGDLIAVGGDGRGGKIKFLRSLDQSSTENKENLGGARKVKNGTKSTTTTQQSRGCLQIEHFFGKANHS